MKIEIFDHKRALDAKAAKDAAGLLRSVLDTRGGARIIAATGASQSDFLGCLSEESQGGTCHFG